MSRRLLVLGWHNIDPTPFYPAAPGTGRRGFARQLALVEKLGTVVPLDEAVTALAEGRSLPPRAIALTFDDGYADWLDAAVPELDRRGMHGTFFLVSDILSGRIGAWWEELADAFDRATAPTLEWDGRTLPLATPEDRRTAQAAVAADLKLVDRETRVASVHRVAAAIAPPAPDRAPLFLDWAGARALAATGHGIGSHTVTHPILSRETPSAQTRELVDSRQALEEGLARTVDLLAYPNGNAGDYDDTTLTRTAAAGYRAAVTTRPGIASSSVSPFEMRRVVLTPHDDLRALIGKVARKGSGVARKVAGKVAGKVGRRPLAGV